MIHSDSSNIHVFKVVCEFCKMYISKRQILYLFSWGFGGLPLTFASPGIRRGIFDFDEIASPKVVWVRVSISTDTFAAWIRPRSVNLWTLRPSTPEECKEYTMITLTLIELNYFNEHNTKINVRIFCTLKQKYDSLKVIFMRREVSDKCPPILIKAKKTTDTRTD